MYTLIKNIRRYYKTIFVLGICCFFVNNDNFADTEKEDKLIAAYIYNFTKAVYIQTPKGNFKSNKDPYTIGIVSDKQFYNFFSNIFKGKKSDNRNIVLRRILSDNSIVGCNLIFIQKSTNEDCNRILGISEKHKILTIGEVTDFWNDNFMIKLSSKKNKISIELNITKTKNADYIVSSRLLNIAKVIEN